MLFLFQLSIVIYLLGYLWYAYRFFNRSKIKDFPIKKLSYGSLIAAKRLRATTKSLIVHVGSIKDTDLGSSTDYFNALETLDDTEWLDSIGWPNA